MTRASSLDLLKIFFPAQWEGTVGSHMVMPCQLTADMELEQKPVGDVGRHADARGSPVIVGFRVLFERVMHSSLPHKSAFGNDKLDCSVGGPVRLTTSQL